MIDHPLSRPDFPLIQDLFLTKIVMLLAGRAHIDEWRFELGVLEDLSAGTWIARNAFLFDYTLARVAVAEAAAIEVPVHREGPDPARNVRAFINAVAAADGAAAQAAWTSFPTGTDETWHSGLTAPLIRSLSAARDAGVRTPDLDQLPPAFAPSPEAPQRG